MDYKIVCMIIATAVLTFLVTFVLFTWTQKNQLHKVREWLLYAVTMAEKELGSGTGKLKLRYVYDLFLTKFPWLARFVTFEMFSELVDKALEEMRPMLEQNEKVSELVNGG